MKALPRYILLAAAALVLCGYLLGNHNAYSPRSHTPGNPLEFGNKLAGGLSPKKLATAALTTHIFYNRVPKCGSTTANTIFQALAEKHGFTLREFPIFPSQPTYSFLEADYQLTFAKWFYKCQRPCLVQSHLNFVDFDRLPPLERNTSTTTLYINLVRDPVARLRSWYYFVRFSHPRNMSAARRSMTYEQCVEQQQPECTERTRVNILVPFFCGQEPMCREPGSASLQRAMRNIREHYAVVGYLENVRQFYRALEWVLPAWFSGASDMYEDMEAAKVSVLRRGTNHTEKGLSETAHRLIHTVLYEEYQLYYFIRQYFHLQFDSVLHVKDDTNIMLTT